MTRVMPSTTAGMVLVCQAMVFSVAINSKKRALTALLIAANFVEIKGTIFKRYDAHKLLTLTRQDVVERFHLLLTLAFVVCEEAQDGFAPARLWALLRCEWLPMCRDVVIMCAHRHCGAIFGSEVVIDVIKHAILGKLNDMRPGMYREFMRDTCEQVRQHRSNECYTNIQNIHAVCGAAKLRVPHSGGGAAVFCSGSGPAAVVARATGLEQLVAVGTRVRIGECAISLHDF